MRRTLTIGIVVMLLCIGTAALAVPYEAQVTARQLAPNTWSYTVRNTSTALDSVLYNVGFYAGWVIDASAPDGWSPYWSGQDGAFWIGAGPFGGPCVMLYIETWDSWLAPGEMLNGVVVEYALPVSRAQMAAQQWQAEFDASTPIIRTGYVLVEEDIVPEPSAMAALGLGLVPIAGCALRRRLQKRSGV